MNRDLHSPELERVNLLANQYEPVRQIHTWLRIVAPAACFLSTRVQLHSTISLIYSMSIGFIDIFVFTLKYLIAWVLHIIR
jgi:hypothetical protein